MIEIGQTRNCVILKSCSIRLIVVPYRLHMHTTLYIYNHFNDARVHSQTHTHIYTNTPTLGGSMRVAYND